MLPKITQRQNYRIKSFVLITLAIGYFLYFLYNEIVHPHRAVTEKVCLGEFKLSSTSEPMDSVAIQRLAHEYHRRRPFLSPKVNFVYIYWLEIRPQQKTTYRMMRYGNSHFIRDQRISAETVVTLDYRKVSPTILKEVAQQAKTDSSITTKALLKHGCEIKTFRYENTTGDPAEMIGDFCTGSRASSPAS